MYEPTTASACGATGGGATSFSIVPRAVGGSGSVAFDTPESVSVKVSSSSSRVSRLVATPTVFDLSPALKVSRPFAAVKSPAPALSPGSADARQATVTCLPLAGERSTVNSTARPSVARSSSTLSAGSGSSSSIVPVTVRPPGRSTAPSPVMRNSKVSSASSLASSAVVTVMVPVLTPGAKLRIPSCGKGSEVRR